MSPGYARSFAVVIEKGGASHVPHELQKSLVEL